MDFSAVSSQTVLGKMLRLPLKLVPSQAKVPILQGRLKGEKWVVGSGVHGYWLGSYETEKQQVLAKLIAQGDVVFDIGAHVGFYSLLASVLVGSTGHVYAFEPLPRNLFYLREHLRLNHISNVTVVEAAVSDRCGVAGFDEGTNSFAGHIAADGNLQVETLCLDEMVPGKIPPPDCIKVDAEGAEMLILSGAESVLANFHPIVLLATHGCLVHGECCRFLEDLGYVLWPLDRKPLEKSRELLAIVEVADT